MRSRRDDECRARELRPAKKQHRKGLRRDMESLSTGRSSLEGLSWKTLASLEDRHWKAFIERAPLEDLHSKTLKSIESGPGEQ